MEQKIAISCQHITKKYRLYGREMDKLRGLLFSHVKTVEFTALSDISVDFYAGEIVGIIGLNGSGKSTLASIITGISYPTSGALTVNGEVNMLSANAGMESNLTGRENIRYKCLLMGMSARQAEALEDRIIEFADIGIYIDQPVKMYSSGMLSRLGFAISVHMDPDILIVDEALSVGDGSFADKCLEKMNAFKASGKTILFVSHSVMQMNDFCDKVMWLHKGRILAMGAPQEILAPYCGFTREYNAMTNTERKDYVPDFEELQRKYLSITGSNDLQRAAVSIFGSCISRDCLEYAPDHSLQLATYIARQSMISAVSPPIGFQKEEIALSSNFRKNMVMHDFSKDAFELFRTDGSEYLMIDLIDERFRIAEFRGSVITASNEFAECGIAAEQELKFLRKKPDDQELLEKVDEFCERIKEIYPEEKIIIHRGRFLDRYISKEGISSTRFPVNVRVYNAKMNALLDGLYARLLKNMPGAFLIDICAGYQCDETHKWGLNPIHYEPAYYEEVVSRVLEYISQKNRLM